MALSRRLIACRILRDGELRESRREKSSVLLSAGCTSSQPNRLASGPASAAGPKRSSIIREQIRSTKASRGSGSNLGSLTETMLRQLHEFMSGRLPETGEEVYAKVRKTMQNARNEAKCVKKKLRPLRLDTEVKRKGRRDRKRSCATVS